MNTPLERMVALAEPPVKDPKKLEKLTTLYNSLLPVERKAKEELAQQIKLLSDAPAAGFQRMSLEPLSWHRRVNLHPYALRKDLPVFAIYSINNPKMVIRLSWSGSRVEYPSSLPLEISSQFTKGWTPGEGTVVLTSEFQGVLPDTIREKVREIDSTPRLEPYLIAEAQWNARVIRSNPDPLLVAWEERSETLWLVDKFDTTPLEEFLTQEFASK